jgi:Domain of unknown function (DUF4350)
MKRANRLGWFIGIFVVVIVLISLIAAPATSKLSSGSTYNRTPDGYAAWYASIRKTGKNIQRWQKPIMGLPFDKQPITLLQVQSQVKQRADSYLASRWVEAGNTLIILGDRQSPVSPDFSTMQKSEVGDIKIDTRHRLKPPKNQEEKSEDQQVLLGDDYGAIVWQEKRGKGQVIVATTPLLAANAYQDYPNNYKYLTQLASQKNSKIYIDEYIHGYKDSLKQRQESVITRENSVRELEKSLITQEKALPGQSNQDIKLKEREQGLSKKEDAVSQEEEKIGNKRGISGREEAVAMREMAVLVREKAVKNPKPAPRDEAIKAREEALSARDRSLKATSDDENNAAIYLGKTPIFLLALQSVVLLLVLIWAKNNRFGQAEKLLAPKIDNSEAYIKALAAVLEKAYATDFVMEMVGNSEKLKLQQSLGLGKTNIDQENITTTWSEKTGENPSQLQEILQLHQQKHRVSEKDLISWLRKWQAIKQIKK